MATAPDQTRNESLISGADAVVESLVRKGLRSFLHIRVVQACHCINHLLVLVIDFELFYHA